MGVKRGGKQRGKILGRIFLGGKYGGQFENKSLRTKGKKLGGKVVSKLEGKHIGAQFRKLWGKIVEVERSG